MKGNLTSLILLLFVLASCSREQTYRTLTDEEAAEIFEFVSITLYLDSKFPQADGKQGFFLAGISASEKKS